MSTKTALAKARAMAVQARQMIAGTSKKPVKWSPQTPTPKQRFLIDLDAREAFFGGAAGPGKSSLLLMAALKYVDLPNYSALIVRRTMPNLEQAGCLIPRSHEWLQGKGAKWNERKKEWIFPSGARLKFASIENEADKYNFASSEYQFCVTGDTRLLMADGSLKKMSEITAGDMVQTLQGPRRVSRKQPARRAQCVQAIIRDSDGRVISSQEQSVDHRLLVKGGVWVSYADMCGVSRHGDFSSPIQSRACGKSASSASRISRFHGRSVLYPSAGLGLLDEQPQSSSDRQWREECGASSVDDRNAHVEFDGKRQELPPPGVSSCLAMRYLPFHRQVTPAQPSQDLRGSGDAHVLSSSSPEGSQGDYRDESDLYDGLFHPILNSALSDLLRLSDAAESVRAYPPLDARGNAPKCNRGEFEYIHPYTMDTVHTSERCVAYPLEMSPIGERDVYDITVADASHYITESGLVNQNCGFDELTEFSETIYTFLFSRVRRNLDSTIPLRIYSASNPGGYGGEWVYERFVKGALPDEDRFIKEVYEDNELQQRFYVPAKLKDNPFIDAKEYISNLRKLDPVTMAQLLNGDWLIRNRGDILDTWDERFHVITWSEFARIYGKRHIPVHWMLARGMDVGASEEHPHCLVWIATAAKNSPFPGTQFVYRSRLWGANVTIHDIAQDIKKAEKAHSENERMRIKVMSHERTHEQLMFNQQYGLQFNKWKPGRTHGISQFRDHLQLRDTDRPNPFRIYRAANGTEIVADSLSDAELLFGRPMQIILVEDGQGELIRNSHSTSEEDRWIVMPGLDEGGQQRVRAEAPAYKWATTLGGQALASPVPHAFFNDMMDCLRGIYSYLPALADASEYEKQQAKLPAAYRDVEMAAAIEQAPTMTAYELQMLTQRMISREYAVGALNKSDKRPAKPSFLRPMRMR